MAEHVSTRRGEPAFFVLVNGNASGSEAAGRLLAEVVGSVRRESGARVRGTITSSEDELRDELAEARGGRAILVGGDGTLQAALNAGVPLPQLALIPAGRANNVARALGIPSDIPAAARLAAGAEARPLDVLRVESEGRTLYGVEGVSAGLQADARSRYDGVNSGELRRGAGALAAAVRDYRPYELEVGIEGRPAVRWEAAQVFFSNLPFFGFGFRVDPVADPRDGMLEAIALRARSRRQLARMLASTYRGTHLARAGATLRRATRAVVSGAPLAVDGTPLPGRSASVMVESGRLELACAA